MPSKSLKGFFRTGLNDVNVSGKHDSYHSVEFGFTASLKATGGTITEPGNGYRYHFFTNESATEQLVCTSTLTFDIIVVGGGGGGGGQTGGGGGAGGYREFSNISFPVGSYDVTVGAGGPQSPLDGRGVAGTDSSVTGAPIPMVSTGGGYGGGGGGPQPGGDGGSGGGGRVKTPSPDNIPGGSGNTPPTSPSQGNPGGMNGGGGGGAGASGNNGPGGAGGIGVAALSGDTGIPPSYGTPGPSPGRWFAGGGGGAPGTASGGAGGGGDANSDNAVANTGGGGGGDTYPGSGHAGASGIIIFRQLIP